jgi:hypothetical protein
MEWVGGWGYNQAFSSTSAGTQCPARRKHGRKGAEGPVAEAAPHLWQLVLHRIRLKAAHFTGREAGREERVCTHPILSVQGLWVLGLYDPWLVTT